MTQGVWIEPMSHLNAYGFIHPDGSMKKASVDDNNGTTRTRDRTFSSKEDFFSWIERQ